MIELKRCFTDEIGFERTRTVVPFHSFAVAVPQFQTMFLFAVFVAEIVLQTENNPHKIENAIEDNRIEKFFQNTHTWRPIEDNNVENVVFLFVSTLFVFLVLNVTMSVSTKVDDDDRNIL